MNDNEPHTTTQPPTKVASSTTAFPSMKALYIESWELLKRTILSQIRLILLLTAGIVGIIVVILISVFLGSAIAGFTGAQNTIYDVILIIGALALIIVYVVALVYVSAISQIVSVKIFNSETRIPIIETAKQAYPTIWPFFGTVFLGQIFVLGGIFAFIVPGIMMAFLFMFVSYVFILENTSGMAALRRSYQLVRPNVKRIFFTMLIAQVAYYVVSNLFSYFSEKYIWLYVLTLPLSIGFSLYISGLNYVLYKHAKAANANHPLPDLRWVKIWATIGLVIFGVIFSFAIFSLSSYFTQAISSGMKLPPIK